MDRLLQRFSGPANGRNRRYADAAHLASNDRFAIPLRSLVIAAVGFRSCPIWDIRRRRPSWLGWVENRHSASGLDEPTCVRRGYGKNQAPGLFPASVHAFRNEVTSGLIKSGRVSGAM